MSEYIRTNKFDTNECPNIFVKEKLIRTNVRIYIRDQYIRIFEYSNIFVTLWFGCIWVYMSVYKWVYIHEYMRVYLDVYGCMDVFGCIWVGVSQPDPRGYTCLMRGAGDWKVFQFHTPHSYHPDHGHKVWPLENQSIITTTTVEWCEVGGHRCKALEMMLHHPD